MKEFRFKILREGDFLCRFSEAEIIIGTENGSYRIYRVSGFDVGEPTFFKNFEEVTIHKEVDLPENIVVVKLDDQYRIYKVTDFKNGFPVFDDKFCVVIKRGIGKLQVFNSEEEITITLPAKEGK